MDDPAAVSDPKRSSTMRAEYIPPSQYAAARKDIAKRRALFKSRIVKEMVEEIKQENLIKPSVEDYCTTYDDLFRIPGFKLPDKEPENTELHMKYPLYSQQPITYYSARVAEGPKGSTNLSGMTKIVNFDSPFKKNGNFSTPVDLKFYETA